jgi:hypothetical protein
MVMVMVMVKRRERDDDDDDDDDGSNAQQGQLLTNLHNLTAWMEASIGNSL